MPPDIARRSLGSQARRYASGDGESLPGGAAAAREGRVMTCAYRLPRAVADRLETALRGRKNAEAALALATWLARFWSAPRRLLAAFPIDRRAIAGREDLGLTEARVRGAIGALEAVGFLDRQEPAAGKRYQRTEEGLHRQPLMFRFAPDY